MLRGEIYWCTLNKESIGSEQKGVRPVVIIQNDIGNRYSPTTVVGVLTKKLNNKKGLPTHVDIKLEDLKDQKTAKEAFFVESIFMAEQILTVDKNRFTGKIGELNETSVRKLNKAIKISLALD